MSNSWFDEMEAKIPRGGVRTRFAPSPTGYMHVGNLRTALYAYLLARKNGGKFILRIEDTDQERYVDGAVDIIYKTLADCGLTHDEGPDVGGDCGPYVQSERQMYKAYAIELIEKGGAYYCFCDKERLDDVRRRQELSKQPPKYDGHCSRLSAAEIDEKIASGLSWVIRQKMPQSGETTFIDEVFGSITTENTVLDDNVLLKSDGMPTYNFANVIDDHLMGITHIIRGSEYLSSTPKYNLLYEAFGWEIPKYIHCSPVMKDSQRKLSKRDGDASYEDFIAKGYLKEAVLNYIALLGWSPKGEREKFTLAEMIEAFDVAGISKSPAIFDENKLLWLNGEYLREMSAEEFHAKALPYFDGIVTSPNIDKTLISALLQKRCEKLTDIPEQVDFFDKLPDYDTELYENKKMKTDCAFSKSVLEQVLPVLESIADWSRDNIHDKLVELVEKMEVKNGMVFNPLRVALSGKPTSPGGSPDLAYILGKEETMNRVRAGIEKL
jgi:glutamyl-tRNA synthetase